MQLSQFLRKLLGTNRKYIPTVEIQFTDENRTSFRVNKVWDKSGDLHEIDDRTEHDWGDGTQGNKAIAQVVTRITGDTLDEVRFHINEP